MHPSTRTYHTHTRTHTLTQATVKPQYVEQIAKSVKGKVADLLTERVENDNLAFMVDILGMWGPVKPIIRFFQIFFSFFFFYSWYFCIRD
jgi:translation initiation factor RLI1